jgi:hypothetical protein
MITTTPHATDAAAMPELLDRAQMLRETLEITLESESPAIDAARFLARELRQAIEDIRDNCCAAKRMEGE